MRLVVPRALGLAAAALLLPAALSAQADSRLDDLKDEVLEMVQDDAKMVQEIVDMLFSFGEFSVIDPAISVRGNLMARISHRFGCHWISLHRLTAGIYSAAHVVALEKAQDTPDARTRTIFVNRLD